jgi:nucleotide-binding universal stress UspA family protein
MIHFNNVLCPVDFSDCSKLALGYAFAMAKRYSARLMVQYVLAPLNIFYYNYMLPGGPDQEFDQEMQRHAGEMLKGFTEEVLAGKCSCEELLSFGKPVTEILKAAKREQANLLIMGTHGRSGLERFLLGSVTEKILRKAPCPVLVVRCGVKQHPGADASEFGGYRGILVPVDLTEHSARTLSHAVELATDFQATLFIVHILEQPSSPGIDPSYTGMLLDYWTEIQSEARRMLDELVRSCVEGKVAEEHWVAIGRPAEEILLASREKNADLIVMGAKPSWLTNLGSMGTTAHRIICHAESPVLLLR